MKCELRHDGCRRGFGSKIFRSSLYFGVISMVLACLMLSQIACTARRQRFTISNLPEHGYQAFSSPRANDAPGTIFRIDRRGVHYTVVESVFSSSDPMTTTSCQAAIATVKREAIFNGEMSLPKILKFAGGISVDQAKNTKLSLQVQLADAVIERTSDAAVQEILHRLNGIKLHERNRYFIIRETVSAKTLTLTVDETTLNELKGSSQSALALRVTNSSNGKYSCTINFECPNGLRVFYKAEEIPVTLFAR